MLFWMLLGAFTLAWITILPNYADATNRSNPADNENLVWDGQTLTWSAFLDTVKNAINWLLGILATVALVFCLYGWFLMVTSAGDDTKYKKWLGVLKYAGIGLAIIGLSWMIVSVIFRFIGTLWGWNQTQSTGSQNVDITSDGTSLRDGGANAGEQTE